MKDPNMPNPPPPHDTAAPFYMNMPRSSRARFFIAVFLVFAPLIILSNSTLAARTLLQIVVWSVVGGAIAVCWAASFVVSRKFLPAAILLSLAAAVSLGMGYPALLRMQSRQPNLAAVAVILMIVFGYVFFVLFIAREGARALRLHTEMRLAQRIHGHLVPPIRFTRATVEIYGQSDASTEMGGDLIDCVEHGPSLDLYLADVSGHGVRAGVLMAMVKSSLRTLLLGGAPLDAIVSDLNRVIGQVKEQDMFVTFACLRFDTPGHAVCCLAGHPPILHYRAATRTLDAIDNDSFPLGVVDHDSYAAQSVDCAPGDLFVLYTDGLIEVMNSAREQFGMDRFRDLIARHAIDRLEQIYSRVLDAVHRHGEQTDDQTLLLVRVK